MAVYGDYDGDARQRHAQDIMEASFMRDAATRPVYVKWVDSGLPSIDKQLDKQLYAKFNAKSYHNITGDEIAYLLQFRKSDLEICDQIKIGSYVCIPNEFGEMEWWLIVHYDDRPMFRQCSILKCLWTYRWVSMVDGQKVIHSCLAAPRKQNSYNSGTWLDYYVQTTENQDVIWMPTNSDTVTILYDTKFLKSDPRRYPPIAWKVSKIEDAVPHGLSKFTLTQEMFDAKRDNADLMIANYYDNYISPVDNIEANINQSYKIVYSGKCAVKAGGGYKKFSIQGLSPESITNVKWDIAFPEGFADKFNYIEDDMSIKIRCLPYYNLIGTTFDLKASINNVEQKISVEVIAL